MAEQEVQKGKATAEKPKGSVRDLKLMFGKVREPNGVEPG